MLTKTTVITLIILIASASAFSQGGKAELVRIEFQARKTSIMLTGTLSNGSEMDYVFAAKKCQKVTIKNTKPSLFDFRVFNNEFAFETEFESSPALTFEIPETGDYLLFVRKKAVAKLRRANFSLTLAIK